MTVRLEEMTWTEVETAINAGTKTVLLAVASIEQHGPHLPLGTDTYLGDELATRIAERLGDTLVAPTIRPGCSGHHLSFPGTVSIPAELLMDLVREYCRSLEGHGFEYLVLLAAHGGNFAPLNTAAPEIARELEEASLITISDLQRNMALMNDAMKEVVPDYDEPVIHAGGIETAMLLAMADDYVREASIEPGYSGDIVLSKLFNVGINYYTENGVLGDASVGTAEAGERVLETLSEAYAEQIRSERESLERDGHR